MEIQTKIEDSKATISILGKLTVNTSPDLTAAVEKLPETVCDLDVDLAGVDYISSAGLRVLVAASRMVAKRNGEMRLFHPDESVMDVFEMTGLADVFTIEQ